MVSDGGWSLRTILLGPYTYSRHRDRTFRSKNITSRRENSRLSGELLGRCRLGTLRDGLYAAWRETSWFLPVALRDTTRSKVGHCENRASDSDECSGRHGQSTRTTMSKRRPRACAESVRMDLHAISAADSQAGSSASRTLDPALGRPRTHGQIGGTFASLLRSSRRSRGFPTSEAHRRSLRIPRTTRPPGE